jgi:hypothetical protein
MRNGRVFRIADAVGLLRVHARANSRFRLIVCERPVPRTPSCCARVVIGEALVDREPKR